MILGSQWLSTYGLQDVDGHQSTPMINSVGNPLRESQNQLLGLPISNGRLYWSISEEGLWEAVALGEEALWPSDSRENSRKDILGVVLTRRPQAPEFINPRRALTLVVA